LLRQWINALPFVSTGSLSVLSIFPARAGKPLSYQMPNLKYRRLPGRCAVFD
jgi:hypothetical protein